MRSEQISARCIALIENIMNMVGATTYKNMRLIKSTIGVKTLNSMM